MTARLRGLTLAALIGYGLAWADRAYGHTPIAVFLLVAAAAWTAGWMTAAVPLTEATAEANRERDEIAARLAQLEDGGTYRAAHPSVRSKVYPLPKQARR